MVDLPDKRILVIGTDALLTAIKEGIYGEELKQVENINKIKNGIRNFPRSYNLEGNLKSTHIHVPFVEAILDKAA